MGKRTVKASNLCGAGEVVVVGGSMLWRKRSQYALFR
jgi:hypothetical protein